MTGMWMFLLANNYGEIGYGMTFLSLIISIFLLLLFWDASDKAPLFALIILAITIFFGMVYMLFHHCKFQIMAQWNISSKIQDGLLYKTIYAN